MNEKKKTEYWERNLRKELSFKNYLMSRKLEELLKLAINEEDEEKLIYIKRVIHMRVNYLDDENKNLSGLEQYLHKRKIKNRYKGSKYEKFIEVKRGRIEKYPIIIILLISCFFSGAYISENFFQWERSRKVIPKKEYDYAGKKFTRKELESILNIKTHLAQEYQKKESFKNSYLRYLDALKIAEELEDKADVESISLKLNSVREKLLEKLKNDIESLKNILEEEELIDRVYETLKLSQLLQEFEKQGEIYSIRGEYFLNNRNFEKARSDYMIAQKLSVDKNIYREKIEEIERNIAKNLQEEREKILRIQNRRRNE